ncbi:hypothetical protein VPH35_053135 [Triticum aestivum]
MEGGGGAVGGGAESGDVQPGKAIAAAGGVTRDCGGSGSGGPHRARAVRFRPRSPSYILRRRRYGCGAKLVDLDKDVAADGEAGVGHAGTLLHRPHVHLLPQDTMIIRDSMQKD